MSWMDPQEALEELASGAHRGDRNAVENLFEIAAPLLVSMVSIRLTAWRLEPNDKEDARQDVLLSARDKYGQYDGRQLGIFCGWIRAICDRKAMTIARRLRRWRRHLVPMPDDELFPETRPPIVTDCRPEIRAAVADCLEKLREKEPLVCEVAVLALLEGLKMAKVAEIVARPQSTVYHQRNRAMEFLKHCLEKKGVEP